jgi:hypothetical protein
MTAPVTDPRPPGALSAGARPTADSQAEDGSAPAAPPLGPGTGGRLAQLGRSARLPVALVVLFAIGITLTVLLAPAPRSNSYLDPAVSSADGAKALAQVLAERGFEVVSAYSTAAALAAVSFASPAGQPSTAKPAVTLLVTSPDLLTAAQRRQLAQARADLVLVAPGAAALRQLAPAVRVASRHAQFHPATAPACDLAAARLAGPASAGGLTYQGPAPAVGCYRVQGNPSVIRYAAAGATITIIGFAPILSNGLLGTEGNAALALNVLNGHPTIVWLTPQPVVAVPAPPVPGRPAPPLIPAAAWLVVAQLLVALLVTIGWRARRFGPLITEPLPVVVRASETVEGHARLYQARRSRDRAGAALREAMLARTKPALGLPPDAPPPAVIGALAARTPMTSAEVERISYGPPPASDLELVRLANDLDELERQVRGQ